jgi:NAD+ synthase (glutamine-hydrolysing)
MALIGMPLRVEGGLFNVAVAVQHGRPLAVVPKSYLPNYREFEEARWFRPGTEVPPGSTARIGDHVVPFGTDVVFGATGLPDLVLAVEICEDYWVHAPPHVAAISAGATVVANLSASNFTVGKSELRRLLGRSASDRGKCAYVYVAAGPGESSTDLAFDADAFVCENGAVLAESRRFARHSQLVTVDVDLDALIHERITTNSFGDCSASVLRERGRPRRVDFDAVPPKAPLRRSVSPHPFLPRDEATLARRCWEIFEIQANALATRIEAARVRSLVLGISGGLDSTHAALVSIEALRIAGFPASALHAVTMPGLGTTDQTRSNAERLAASLGASFTTIGISEMSAVVLGAISHPAMEAAGSETLAGLEAIADLDDLVQRLRDDPELGDATLENVQARARTLVLMSLANQHQGLVVGTGDLSEKALGWSTYAGDHIAMYDVNAGVPKTLIQFVIRWVANERAAAWDHDDPEDLREVLGDVLDTPISPELLPPNASGSIAQLTEDHLGPYELHDFFLHHFVRRGATPERILFLAGVAFGDQYELAARKRWLRTFFSRFFRNQFKRSCTADGPKVGMVALSPRGDWRMPSDAQVRSWLHAIDRYTEA